MIEGEDCTICTEQLGSAERPAVQLPCGHAFCKVCVEEWQRAKHTDCPQCRQDFQPSRVRALWPWEHGLRLREPARAEQKAVDELDDARAQRKAMESRASKAERALRQLQAEVAAGRLVTTAAVPEPESSCACSSAAATSTMLELACAPAPPPPPPPVFGAAGVPPPPPTCMATLLPPAPPPEATVAVASAGVPAAATATAPTAEQQQRAAANRAAALERKRKREEAQQLQVQQQHHQQNGAGPAGTASGVAGS